MSAFSQVRQWSRRAAAALGISNLIDRRDHQRVKADFHAILSGTCGIVQARGLDITSRSIGVQSTRPIQKGVSVFVELLECGTGGFAHVRRCERRPDGTYTIGLQFRKELKANRVEIGSWEHYRVSHGPLGAWDSAEA